MRRPGASKRPSGRRMPTPHHPVAEETPVTMKMRDWDLSTLFVSLLESTLAA
jgi:hypothetical protein